MPTHPTTHKPAEAVHQIDEPQAEALRLANVCSNLTRYSMDAHLIAAELRRQHTRIAELEALSGVQALSAAPVAFLKSVIALCSHRGYSPANIEVWDKDDKWIADLWRQAESMLTTSPTPPAEQQAEPGVAYAELPEKYYLAGGEVPTWDAKQMRAFADRTHALRMQAAPKTAPEVGNSGFDHKTAADLLNNKTVSDEAVRKFVAASRWAHDERAALSATLLAMHGVLTSREAEIALLKKALLEAEAAPQQEVQEPVVAAVFDEQLGRPMLVEGAPMLSHGQPLYTAPQPAPAPLSESIDQVERALAIIGVVGAIDGHDVVRRESVLEIARRAALAAQGGGSK